MLTSCPNECSAYIQKKKIKEHLTRCPKNDTTKQDIQNDEEELRLNNPNETINELEEKVVILEQDISAIRNALNEETKQRHRLITDVGVLRRHNTISDEWTLKIGDVLAAFKKCLNEESESRYIDMTQIRVDIGRIALEYQVNIGIIFIIFEGSIFC